MLSPVVGEDGYKLISNKVIHANASNEKLNILIGIGEQPYMKYKMRRIDPVPYPDSFSFYIVSNYVFKEGLKLLEDSYTFSKVLTVVINETYVDNFTL